MTALLENTRGSLWDGTQLEDFFFKSFKIKSLNFRTQLKRHTELYLFLTLMFTWMTHGGSGSMFR